MKIDEFLNHCEKKDIIGVAFKQQNFKVTEELKDLFFEALNKEFDKLHGSKFQLDKAKEIKNRWLRIESVYKERGCAINQIYKDVEHKISVATAVNIKKMKNTRGDKDQMPSDKTIKTIEMIEEKIHLQEFPKPSLRYKHKTRIKKS